MHLFDLEISHSVIFTDKNPEMEDISIIQLEILSILFFLCACACASVSESVSVSVYAFVHCVRAYA